MTRWPMQFRCLVFVQICTVCCYAATSSDLTLSACDYTSENYYVVNTTDPQGVFPSGYVECANNATLCGDCTCREKKVTSIAGVLVAWVVCIESASCATGNGTAQEYCGSSYDMKTTDASCSDGSSSCERVKTNASDHSSFTSTEGSIINGSDASAEIISIPGSTSRTNSLSTNPSTDTSDAFDNGTIGSGSTGVISASGSTSTNSPSINASVDSSLDIDSTISSDAPMAVMSTSNSDTSEGSMSTSASASSTNSSTSNKSVDSSIDLDGSTDRSGDNPGGISTSGSTSSTNSTNTDPSINANADGRDASAEAISTSGSTSGTNSPSKIDTSVIDSSNTSSGSAISNKEKTPVSTPSATDRENLTLPPQGSTSEATNEENVISNVVGTVGPSQTNTDTSTGENIIRPSEGSAHQLDTNNGASTNSSWSGTRLTTTLSIMGAIAAVAVIAVFAAVRKDQVKQNELGTPTEVYTDDGSSLATPMTHRLDGKYCHGSYGRRTTDLVDASDNTPLASIVVIGPDDDFHTPNGFTSTHRYRSYDGTEQRTRSTKANSNYHENAVIPAQQQLGTIEDPIFDSLDTQVSFSSSSDPPSYEFEDNLPDSYFMVSATYSEGSDLGSDVSTAPRQHQTPSISGDEDSSNATGSFASSLESENYDVRDTEASEHIYESELCTNSSRVAMSFDMGSV